MSILPPVGWDDQAEPVQPQPMTADELNAIRERVGQDWEWAGLPTVKERDRSALLAEVDRLRDELASEADARAIEAAQLRAMRDGYRAEVDRLRAENAEAWNRGYYYAVGLRPSHNPYRLSDTP